MKNEKSGASTIFKSLLSDISEGILRPGDSLESEQSLMDRFDVSRTMIRDAVAMLAGIGAIDRARGRTGVIKKVDSSTISHLFPLILRLNGKESLREVYELRILIESEAAAKAAIKADIDELNKISILAEEYASAAGERKEKKETFEEGTHIDLDVNLHLAIAHASGNVMYLTLLEVLTGFLRYVQFESCRGNLLRSSEAAFEHSRIARAIKERDPDAARVEMNHHLRVSQELLEESLEDFS